MLEADENAEDVALVAVELTPAAVEADELVVPTTELDADGDAEDVPLITEELPLEALDAG